MTEPTTKMIQMIKVENQARLIKVVEKLATILIVGGLALAAMWMGVVEWDSLHVLLPYVGLRVSESLIRGPAAKATQKMLGGDA